MPMLPDRMKTEYTFTWSADHAANEKEIAETTRALVSASDPVRNRTFTGE